MDRSSILSNGETLSIWLSNNIHQLNNGDVDFVYISLVKLLPEEHLPVFLELVAVYVPARQGTEFEFNYLNTFFSAILTGSNPFVELIRDKQHGFS
jgi:hypothetical protein